MEKSMIYFWAQTKLFPFTTSFKHFMCPSISMRPFGTMATKIFTTILKQYFKLNILYVMNTFDIMFPAEKHFQSSQSEHITKQINKFGLIFK